MDLKSGRGRSRVSASPVEQAQGSGLTKLIYNRHSVAHSRCLGTLCCLVRVENVKSEQLWESI
jgi:hypothetical protein